MQVLADTSQRPDPSRQASVARVTVEARWDAGRWWRLATVRANDGFFRVRYLITRPGLLHLRIALPDGNYLVGTTRVT